LNVPSAPAHAFISYSSQDAAIANTVVAALEQAGQKCWLAPRDVIPGAQYADEIIGAINDASVIVLVLSSQSIESPHVGKEIERASSKRRRIIALRTDTTPLTRSLEYFLSESQWIDYRREDAAAALAKLVSAVQAQGRHGADHAASATVAPASTASKKSWPLIAAVGVLGVALAGFVIDKFLASRRAPMDKPAAAQTTEPAAATANLPTTSVASEKSIAVLPFTDLSERKDQEYFSDGLSEELIDLLTKVPDLRVPARASSFYFKGQHVTLPEIAKELGVAYLLEGSVRKAGNKVRVTAELIRADNGYNVWSETYDRDLKDIFKVQDEIAGRVVSALKSVLPSARAANIDRTANTEAYNQFLLGRKFERANDDVSLRQAVDAFRKATTLDPTYVDGFSWLAVAEAELGDRTGDAAMITHALVMADRAIALGPRDPGGYATRGWIRCQWRWDWAGAKKDLDQAEALTAGFSSGLEFARATLAMTEGRLEDAIAILTRSSQHDPLDPYDWGELVGYLAVDGNFAQAHAVLERMRIIAPNSGYVRASQFSLDLLEGKMNDALADAGNLKGRIWQLRGAALAQHSLGHARESQQALDELIGTMASQSAFQIAEVYAWDGEKDQAFTWLDRAYAQRDAGLTSVKWDTILASLRIDPRYKALLIKMKLPL
jgi:TolB-like protein/Tfp pilus assembly protein PilF